MQPDFEPLLGKTRPLFLRTLHLPPTLRVVVLAPHPDDFDAIGITMRTLRDNGNRIDVVVLTSGASGVDDDFAAQLTVQGKAVLREQEQRASCQFFGLPPDQLTFLRLDEDTKGHLEVSEQNLMQLRTYWDAHAPDLVFLPQRIVNRTFEVAIVEAKGIKEARPLYQPGSLKRGNSLGALAIYNFVRALTASFRGLLQEKR